MITLSLAEVQCCCEDVGLQPSWHNVSITERMTHFHCFWIKFCFELLLFAYLFCNTGCWLWQHVLLYSFLLTMTFKSFPISYNIKKLPERKKNENMIYMISQLWAWMCYPCRGLVACPWPTVPRLLSCDSWERLWGFTYLAWAGSAVFF